MSAPVLFCAGAHGKDVAAIYRRVHGDDIVMYDDDPELQMLPPESSYWLACYVCTYSPTERARLVEKQTLLGGAPLIDPSAVVGDDCSLGKGSVIGPNSVLLTDVYIGQHVHVGYSVGMTRCRIGAFTTISPGATVCGNVEIGQQCFIGANATICDRVTVGHGAVVAAGAILPPLSVVPSETVVKGVYK